MKRILPDNYSNGVTTFTNLHRGLSLLEKFCGPLSDLHQCYDSNILNWETSLVDDVEIAICNGKDYVELGPYWTKSGHPEDINFTVEEILDEYEEYMVEAIVTFI